MIEQLFNKLETKRTLSDKSKELLSELVFIRKYQPGDMFLRMGNVSDEIGFVLSGIFRSLTHHKNVGERTIEFVGKDYFLSNPNSFYMQTKSKYTIECELESEVFIITREVWEKFEKEIPDWRRTINYIRSNYLLERHNFQGEILNQESLTSYRRFSEKFPTIIHNVPLGHIASFLGITQSTLSRIRKKDLNSK